MTPLQLVIWESFDYAKMPSTINKRIKNAYQISERLLTNGFDVNEVVNDVADVSHMALACATSFQTLVVIPVTMSVMANQRRLPQKGRR